VRVYPRPLLGLDAHLLNRKEAKTPSNQDLSTDHTRTGKVRIRDCRGAAVVPRGLLSKGYW